ncbi:hypothetical protein Trydic_g9572 [Trypoxylus dichotomus]
MFCRLTDPWFTKAASLENNSQRKKLRFICICCRAHWHVKQFSNHEGLGTNIRGKDDIYGALKFSKPALGQFGIASYSSCTGLGIISHCG